jgi:hypothetical protein
MSNLFIWIYSGARAWSPWNNLGGASYKSLGTFKVQSLRINRHPSLIFLGLVVEYDQFWYRHDKWNDTSTIKITAIYDNNFTRSVNTRFHQGTFTGGASDERQQFNFGVGHQCWLQIWNVNKGGQFLFDFGNLLPLSEFKCRLILSLQRHSLSAVQRLMFKVLIWTAMRISGLNKFNLEVDGHLCSPALAIRFADFI